MNRTIKETDPLNHATETAYDLCGNIVSVTDGNKHTTTYTYDGLNRISSVTSAEGSVTEYTYDYLGNVASLTVDGGNNTRATTAYAYDGEGNLLSETDAAGSATTYTYDGEGNALTKTDRSGQETTFTYDDLNRLTKRTDADGTANFAYDKVGNLTSAADATGAVTFAYDALYRTTQVNDNGAVIGYAYNAASQRTALTYPDGKTVTTAYDVMGNVTSLTDYDGSFIAYDRDAEGRVIKEAHSDGSTTEYDYNKAGQLVEQKEVAPDNATRRKILYGYDDAGNLTSENRTGVDFDRRDESVRYYYDKDNRLTSTVAEGKTTAYAYDLAGNLLSDGEAAYTYDIQNRLLTKSGANGTITYEYDAAGNLVKETNPDGTVSYTYNAQNKLVKGELSDGQSSIYTYNALGARIENVQVRANENAGYQNADLTDGSHGTDYLDFLRDGRADWQRAWESEVGTTHQNDYETVTRHYVVDYLSAANRDLIATEDGSYATRYVYDENSIRISAEFDYADGTQRGEAGENLQSDFAAEREKVWYRWSLLGSTLFAVDASGEVVAHAIYDAWGNPLTETYPDANFSGLENTNNYTGYTYDETLGLYFAQNRFYAADLHRFTQEDIVKDGNNWYAYCGNNPVIFTDPLGYSFWTDVQATFTKWGSNISAWGKEKIEQAKIWITEQVGSLVQTVTSYTIHFTDPVRQEDVLFGMVSAAILSAGDTGAAVLQALINGGRILVGKLPSMEYFNLHLKTAADIDRYFASKCTYIDSYYFGKMLGDIVSAGAGIGMTVASIFEMIGGAGVTGIGVATAPEGVGVGIAAIGAAVTAEGVATATAGIAIAMASVGNFGGDKGQFDYYRKLACEEFQNKWDEILGKSTKRNSTKGNKAIYERKDSKGFSTAKADFDSLELSNVKTINKPNGEKTYTGITPNGKTINLHNSSTEGGRWTLEFEKIKVRY